MRDEDVDEATAAARHNELRDIHHRIDALKEESERQYESLTSKLHALEVAIASGSRFPASAWMAAATLFLTVLGSGFITYHKLETAQTNSIKAIQLIEAHMQGASARLEALQTASGAAEQFQLRMPVLEERVKTLEGKIVGQGPEGWHRRDHDLYAKMIDERNDRVRSRLDAIEKKQELICERVRECKR